MSKVAQLREQREKQAAKVRLQELEATIEKSAEAVWDMAQALKEIKEDELWRQTHDSWKDYCEDRWGISRGWAHATIQAVEVRRQLDGEDVISRGLLHVKQASRLATIPEEDRKEVWDSAVSKAEKEGKDAPSLHRHLEPTIREYRKQGRAPRPAPKPADEAHEAASTFRRDSERVVASLEALVPHLDNLTEDEAQGCAYKVVETVQAMMGILEENDLIRADVARAVVGEDELSGKVEVHV